MLVFAGRRTSADARTRTCFSMLSALARDLVYVTDNLLASVVECAREGRYAEM